MSKLMMPDRLSVNSAIQASEVLPLSQRANSQTPNMPMAMAMKCPPYQYRFSGSHENPIAGCIAAPTSHGFFGEPHSPLRPQLSASTAS